MDWRNVQTMVNLTGGVGSGLAESVRTFQSPPARFVVFTEPSWDRIIEPGYARWQADELGRAKAAGARGVKVLKTLGLYLREQVTSGPLVKIDDPRFDPLWEACGALSLPVAMHISDPEAFFLPIDRFNERYEELHAHPDWSFHGKDYPSNAELLAARDRVLARHPRPPSSGCTSGTARRTWPRCPPRLDRFPNFHVEIGARIGELGRQPRASRRFFDRYQDRVLFGTDAVPNGHPDAAADLRRRALQDLLQVSRDRRRVLRLRAGKGPTAGPLADLRRGIAGRRFSGRSTTRMRAAC